MGVEENLIKEEIKKETSFSRICPDYDEDCKAMSYSRAEWCFFGCQNHPCSPNNSLGIAEGICPIIHNSN